MEYQDPPTDKQDRDAWARAVLRYRSWWITEVSGTAVLRQAARILGDETVQSIDRYIEKHGPPLVPD